MTTYTLPDLEHALMQAAYLVELHGDAYVPVMDRLEQEVLAARERSSGRSRAQRILSSLSIDVSPKHQRIGRL
jgi:hypothetical protein